MLVLRLVIARTSESSPRPSRELIISDKGVKTKNVPSREEVTMGGPNKFDKRGFDSLIGLPGGGQYFRTKARLGSVKSEDTLP